jgi:phosphatidylserine/phosphatidylglycerophosphate/cardiolipin synthase-like enzyme
MHPKFGVAMKQIRLMRGLVIFFNVFLLLTAPLAALGESRTEAAEGEGAGSVTLLENNDYFPALIDSIDHAESEIIISIFSFKAGVHFRSYPDQILAALARAVKRGVGVNVILEVTGDRTNDLTAQNLKTKILLEEKGVKVYLDSPKKTTHTKVVLVDNRIVFLGSHNFTSSALKHNNEISVLIEQPRLARKVRQYLLRIMKEAK